MRKVSIIFVLSAALAAPALFAADEVEVSFADLVAKPADFEGKTIKLSCEVIFIGSDKLAVAGVNLEAEETPYEGDAIYLSGVKSSVKKSLAKTKYNKKTCYHGTAEIIGKVSTGEFGKAKYKIKISVKSMTAEGGGSASGEFKPLKKNLRVNPLATEDQVKSQSRAHGKDGFPVPNYPKYTDGSGLAASTPVCIVTDRKVTKVFPITYMGHHELANIKVGKLPIAMTW
ncbi:MAG: hypothetical protein ACYS8W_03490 [Planctomycetota bacterium]